MLQPIVLQDEEIWKTSNYKNQYLGNMVRNTEYVLCSVSAAEYLGLCNATTGRNVYVLMKQDCINHHIDITSKHEVYYTTINQTINDLLADNTMDEQVIMESLADQFFENNYANITILPENQVAFAHFKQGAEEYYSYD